METEITLEVRGAEYKVELSERGLFSTEVGDQRCHADSLEKLREKIMKATRQSNLDIRFARPNSDGSVRYGIVTGIHGSQRALLVHWNDGKRETIQSYNANDMLDPLSYEEARRFSDLVRVAAVANGEVLKFRAEHKLNAWQRAQDAAKAAADKEEK